MLSNHLLDTRSSSGGSYGKESACNTGDPGSIPVSVRSPGEGIGYSLQYSWASLVAQRIKTLPAMWVMWVRSLSWEDPLEEGMATHSSILAWRIPMVRGAWRAPPWGSQRVRLNGTIKQAYYRSLLCFLLAASFLILIFSQLNSEVLLDSSSLRYGLEIASK